MFREPTSIHLLLLGNWGGLSKYEHGRFGLLPHVPNVIHVPTGKTRIECTLEFELTSEPEPLQLCMAGKPEK